MLPSESEGWAWFEPEPDASTQATAAPNVRDAFVRAFASDAGRQALAYLRANTIERRTPPDASEAALRHLEGQRSLVAAIERLARPLGDDRL